MNQTLKSWYVVMHFVVAVWDVHFVLPSPPPKNKFLSAWWVDIRVWGANTAAVNLEFESMMVASNHSIVFFRICFFFRSGCVLFVFTKGARWYGSNGNGNPNIQSNPNQWSDHGTIEPLPFSFYRTFCGWIISSTTSVTTIYGWTMDLFEDVWNLLKMGDIPASYVSFTGG